MTKILKYNGKILKTVSFTNTGYGLLYNYYAASHADKITSSNDWIIPTSANIVTMLNYLGGALVSGGYLKESGTTFWNSPNTSANNNSLFNGRGAGTRNADGSFSAIKNYLYLITTTPNGGSDYFMHYIQYNSAAVVEAASLGFKAGRSIRLLKTSTSLTNGQSGTYIGNDGKIYRTICIGTQEWLADNLAETKYRNGNDIAEVSNATDWSNLTSGALCAYDNDWDNVGLVIRSVNILKTT